MIDTVPKLEQCARCSAYVWTAYSGGLHVTADPGPVDTARLVETLAAGRRLFEVLEAAGRPSKLLGRTPGSPRPTEGPDGALRGAQGRRIVAEHACGALVATRRVETTAEQRHQSPCDAWRAQGWTPPATCPRRGADAATDQLFGDIKAPRSCPTCEPPPFDHAGNGLRRPRSPSAVPDGQPDPKGAHSADATANRGNPWATSTRTASAEHSGHTAPPVTGLSAPMEQQTSTAKAPTAEKCTASTPKQSGLSKGTAYGDTRRLKPRSDDPVWYPAPPKSERLAPCDICGEYVMQSQMHLGVQVGAAWMYIRHEECGK